MLMQTITMNYSDITPIPGRHRLVTEASTAGIKPGSRWPDSVFIIGMNAGVRFNKAEEMRELDGEFHGVRYRSVDGVWSLTILND